MARAFSAADTPLPGLRVLTRRYLADARGGFSRLYCEQELQESGWNGSVAQSNFSRTLDRGTVRGMHFQRAPHVEDKLVTCVRGEVFDVAVDLRRGSPTFLHWHAVVLSEHNHRSLLIPKGFAHGFQTLAEGCDLVYMHSAAYFPGVEGGVSPLDPRLDIQWPLPVGNLSDRDRAHLPLTDDFTGIETP